MKFLFYPAPAHGHVNPMLPLIQELVSRGDEVAVWDVTREFEAAVRHTGASPRLLDDAVGVVLPTSPCPAWGADRWMKLMMPVLLGLMRRSMQCGSPR